MKTNLLENWEKEISVDASDFNPKRKLKVNRAHVLKVKRQLEDFFTPAFFEVNTFNKYLKMSNPVGSNWVHSLLTTTNPKAINQVFELAAILEHFQKQNGYLLENLLLYKDLKNFRQFRDYYFELYTLYTLDRNGVENEKKIFEGKKELEGEAILNGKKCLIECKKLYYDKAENLKMNTQIVSKLSEKFHKKAYPIIICVRYSTPVLGFLNIIAKEVTKIIADWEKPGKSLILPVVRHYYDQKVELYVEPYSPGRIDGVKNESNLDKNFVVFGIKPSTLKQVQRYGHFMQGVYSHVISTDSEIEKQLIKNIIKKRKNRSDSKYDYRVFFFESENYPGFDRGLLSPDGFSDKLKSGIEKYLISKSTKDVLVMIEKESNDIQVPRIRHTVIGNQGTHLPHPNFQNSGIKIPIG